MLRSALLIFTVGIAAGCSIMPSSEPIKTAPPAAKTDPSLGVIAEDLEMMTRLNQGSPAEQAEIFQSARDAADTAPTTSAVLRYALALATPGHGATDLTLARQKLSELISTPEKLMPAERSLAMVVLDNVDQRLILQNENRRLQEASARLERERGAATNRRLQAEIEENARLKRQLAEAQAKLDEIARIERSIIDRKPNNNGSR